MSCGNNGFLEQNPAQLHLSGVTRPADVQTVSVVPLPLVLGVLALQPCILLDMLVLSLVLVLVDDSVPNGGVYRLSQCSLRLARAETASLLFARPAASVRVTTAQR